MTEDEGNLKKESAPDAGFFMRQKNIIFDGISILSYQRMAEEQLVLLRLRVEPTPENPDQIRVPLCVKDHNGLFIAYAVSWEHVLQITQVFRAGYNAARRNNPRAT